MKKTIALLLALAMCFTLCACGGEGKTDNSSLSFGDTITSASGMFTFTPSFDGFASALSNWGDETYLLPEGSEKDLEASDNPYNAEDGKVMMYFSALLECVGEAKEKVSFDFSFRIEHDGYIFDSNSSDVTSPKGYSEDQESWDIGSGVTAAFEPMSSATTRYVRFAIEVPEQLKTDTEKETVLVLVIEEKEYSFIVDVKAAAEAEAARLAAAEAERADKLTEVDEALASEIMGKLQGTWSFSTYGTAGTSTYKVTHDITFSGDTVAIKTYNTLVNSTLSNTGTYYVGKGYIVLNFQDGSQALMPYTYENGEIAMSSEFEGSFYTA